MTSQLQLAVNHAVNDYRMMRSRQNLANPGFHNTGSTSMQPGLDAKRAQAWCEYGYPGNLGFIDFYKLYARGGIAAGAVNKLAGRCWGTNPGLVQGDMEEKDKDVTPWEESLKPILRDGRLWRQLFEADKRRLIGRYAGLILRIRDNRPLNQPVIKGRGLAEIIVAWAGSLFPYEYDTSLNSENYGHVKMWRYREPSLNGQPVRDVDVHPDRVFILGDWRADAIGFLEPVFNDFVDLEKAKGGSGESIAKNSARSIHVNFDGTVDLRNLAAMYGVSIDELQTRFNDVAREVNAGNDILFVTQGATATPLVANVPDPRPIFEVALQSVSAGVDIPSKILVGNQTGERASTEDEAYMNRRCQGRCNNELSYEVHDFFDKLIDLRVIEGPPGGEYTVVFPDLTEPTMSERLGNAKTMGEINALQTSNGMGSEVFAREQILGITGLEDMVDANDPEFKQPPLPDANPDVIPGDDDEEDGANA